MANAILLSAKIRKKASTMSTALKLHPHFVTDDLGKKTAVILPIAEYSELLEDLEDLAVIAERRDEPTLSHKEFTAELMRDGLL